MKKAFHLSVFVFVVSFLTLANCLERQYTFELAAGARDCFYESLEKDKRVEVEFQVMQGGELDVDFSVLMPNQQVWFQDLRKTEKRQPFVPPEAGDYAFCFNNQFSAYSPKVVFFQLVVEHVAGDPVFNDYDDLEGPGDSFEYEMKLEDIKASMEMIKINLDRSEHFQNILRAIENRDRAVQERNFERVNFWSGVQLAVMILVALVQVYTIRSLFDDENKLRKIVRNFKQR